MARAPRGAPRPPELMPACTACASVVSPVLPVAPKSAIFLTTMLRSRRGARPPSRRTRGNWLAAGPPSRSSWRGADGAGPARRATPPPASGPGVGAGLTTPLGGENAVGVARRAAPPAAQDRPLRPPLRLGGVAACGRLGRARADPSAPPPRSDSQGGAGRARATPTSLSWLTPPLPGPRGQPGTLRPRASWKLQGRK